MRSGETLRCRSRVMLVPGERPALLLPAGLRPLLLERPPAPMPSVRVRADCRLLMRNSSSLRPASARASSASVAASRPWASLSCSCVCAAESAATCARRARLRASSCSFFSPPRASCSCADSSRSQPCQLLSCSASLRCRTAS